MSTALSSDRGSGPKAGARATESSLRAVTLLVTRPRCLVSDGRETRPEAVANRRVGATCSYTVGSQAQGPGSRQAGGLYGRQRCGPQWITLYVLVAQARHTWACPSRRQPDRAGQERQPLPGRRRKSEGVEIAAPAASASKSLQSAGYPQRQAAACIQTDPIL